MEYATSAQLALLQAAYVCAEMAEQRAARFDGAPDPVYLAEVAAMLPKLEDSELREAYAARRAFNNPTSHKICDMLLAELRRRIAAYK